jgi:lysophospholipase L1-like esterase
LGKPNNGLLPTDRITLFGDSLSWSERYFAVCFMCEMMLCCVSYRLGGYESLIRGALSASGVGDVLVVNRGMNGAKLNDLVYGSEEWRMPSFVNSFAADRPTIAVILVGTNDAPALANLPDFRVGYSRVLCHSLA